MTGMKKKKLKISKARTVLLTVFLSGAAVAGVIAFNWYQDNRMAALERDGVVLVYPEMTADEVVAAISEKCGILHSRSFARTFEKELKSSGLRPGSYLLQSEFSARFIARMLTRGWQDPVKLVIAGRIRTVEDLAENISSQMMAPQDEIVAILKDSAFLAGLGTTPSKVFEAIIPDTYEMYWDSSAEKIITRLKKDRDAYWNEDRVAAAQRQGLSPEQVSVLASIISEESYRPDEYPKIASVYLTRLRRGMKLQACPTVCYLLDYKINRVLNRHLKIDSPYNTYMYEGLPPTPIALPDKKHIEAVLHPDSTPYLYFCADSSFNGRNVFSYTLKEHNARRDEYVKAFEERQRIKKQQSQDEDAGPSAQ